MTVSSRAFAAMLKIGPPVTRELTVERDVPVRAPDGADLLTDVYLARAREPLPVILMRTPYGRRGPYGTIARLFAERGYQAVVQSTRGTAGFRRADRLRPRGRRRPGGGRLDHQAAMVERRDRRVRRQLPDLHPARAGLDRPPQLKAMALGVWGAERRALYYPGGAFSLDWLAWAFVIENQERPLASVRTPLRVRRALAPAFAHLSLLDADMVAVGHPVGFYRDSVQHDQPGDPYWTPTDFRPALRDLGIPATMIGGWYDMSLPSMLADYQALREGGQTARLRVGPGTTQARTCSATPSRTPWNGSALTCSAARHRPGPPFGSRRWGRRMARPATVATGGQHQRWHLQPHGALAIPVPPAGEPGNTIPPTHRSRPANAGPTTTGNWSGGPTS